MMTKSKANTSIYPRVRRILLGLNGQGSISLG